jgi:integrase
MLGWIRVNRGKNKTSYYVVIPWDRMDGSGKKNNWQFKSDERGFRFESEAHARQTLEHFRVLIRSGNFNPLDWIEGKPHAFEKLAQTYLKDYEQALERGEISPSTLAYKQRFMELYYLRFFTGQDVKVIIPLTLKHFHNQLPMNLGAKTRHNIMAELHKFFTWCEDEGVIKAVPRFKGMRMLKRLAREERPEPRESTHLMTDIDFERALKQMAEDDRPIFNFIRLTGCRPSEARAFSRQDIDWHSNIIEIRRTWSGGGTGEVLVDRAKSGSDRPLYLTAALRSVVKSVSPRLDHPFVFWNKKTGKPYTRRELDYRWRKALEKADLPHMALKNATRSSFVCQRLKDGNTYEEIGAVVGHRHVSTTRWYGQIFVEQTRKVLERTTKLQPNSIT